MSEPTYRTQITDGDSLDARFFFIHGKELFPVHERQEKDPGTEFMSSDSANDALSASSSIGIRDQLHSMRSLKDGWLDGGGIAPCSEGLDWLAEAFGRYYPEDSPRPYLYPTEEGGVQAEWSLAHQRISLEINLESRYGDWFSLDLETDKADERQLRCDKPSDWQWLVRRIQDLSRGVE